MVNPPSLLSFLISSQAISKFQAAAEIQQTHELYYHWGDALLQIAITSSIPIFDEALENFNRAISLSPLSYHYKVHRKIACLFYREAEYCHVRKGGRPLPSLSKPRDLWKQGDKYFNQCILEHPKCYKTLFVWSKL